MSDRDPPGRDNRTVIRPNPGGRRPFAPPTPAQQPPPTAPPPVSNVNPAARIDWDQGSPPPAHWAQGPGAVGAQVDSVPIPGLRQGPGQGGNWVDPNVAPGQGQQRLARELAHFEQLEAPNADPLLRAAAPLLLVLGRLRASLLKARLANLMDEVAQAITKFETDIRAAGLAEDQVTMAKYIVCSAADDIVQNLPVEDRVAWPQYGMLASFFGERIGGVRFFDIVDRAKQDPTVYYSQLELQHACLALGFQGRYRSEGGGFAALQQIQRSIYETLRRVRPRTARELSPHWRGQQLVRKRPWLSVPIWAVSGVVSLLLVVLFIVLRYLLTGGAEAAASNVIALDPPRQIGIARKNFAPPPPPPAPTPTQASQLTRIRTTLAPEIAAGAVSVPEPGPDWVTINIGNLVLFRSGYADVLDKFKPLADKLRRVIESETGPVKVIGHTDNQPLSATNKFKSNYDLSVARATNVAALLKNGSADPARFAVEGKGPDQPIADNKTEAGRGINRRVEILIRRKD